MTTSSKLRPNQVTEGFHKISNPKQKRLFTLKEAAEYLGRSEWGVRELIWASVPDSKFHVGRRSQMAKDLLSMNGKINSEFNNEAWRNVYNLANQYGWQPLGTKTPEEDWPGHEWNGNYFSNDGQLVTAEDAKAMSEALELALIDIQKFRRPEEPKINELSFNSPLAFFKGKGEEVLRRFIDFCQKGAFYIW